MNRKPRVVAVACVLAFSVVASFPAEGKAKVEKPVFLVSYCHEFTDPSQSIELAVWKSGRVIWRVGKTGRSPTDSDIWLKGRYYEGQIPRERVIATLHLVRSKKLIGRVDWATGIWPTRSPRRIEIRDGARYSRLGLEGAETVSLRAQKVWKQVKPTLIPKTGRLIPAPDARKWE